MSKQNEELQERIDLLESVIELKKQVDSITNEELEERIQLLEQVVELEKETS